MSRSVPHRPTTSGLISTSPGPGAGMPRSSSTTSPGRRTTSAGPRSPLMTGAGSRGRRPLRLRSFRQAEVDVRAAAQDAGHVIGVAAHEPPELVDAPGGEIALDAGHADRAGAGPVVAEERRAHAEDPLRVLLVIDGEAEPPDRGQVVQQRVDVADGVRGPGGQLGLPGQVLDYRAAQVTERELPADDVTQPDQSRAERVAGPGVRVAQI